jgi:hypothetical protein
MMKPNEQILLATAGANSVSSSMTPWVQTLQPILSTILIFVQIAVAVVTVLVLVKTLKKKDKSGD